MSQLLKEDLNIPRKVGERYNFIKFMLDKASYTGPMQGVPGLEAVKYWQNWIEEIQRLEGRASEFVIRSDELKVTAQMKTTSYVVVSYEKGKYIHFTFILNRAARRSALYLTPTFLNKSVPVSDH